jgi:predicted DNA-binding transcriptional regulator AlpA
LSSTLVNRNDFPREVLLEAIVRFVEEDLENVTATEPGAVGGT